MGKLILGIIAVVILQFAFFAYTAIYWQGYPRPEISKAEKPPVPRKAILVPPIVEAPREPVIDAAPSARVPDARTDRAASARQRTDPAGPDRVSARRTPVRRIIPSSTYSASVVRKPQAPLTLPTAPGPARGGYSVVVVDNLAVTRDLRASESLKPKKRSLFARAFTGVVKKPWRWMKSIASKLD